MRYLFNNCRGRNHTTLFGTDAFYDLNMHGLQATQANDIKPGDECIVATYCEDGDVRFSWFTFTHHATLRPHGGSDSELFRVQFGKAGKVETMSKAQAAQTIPYSKFFNVNGDFKQQSVIETED